MEALPDRTDPPPPPERRFEPRRREDAEAVIRWLRVLGGRFEPGQAIRRSSREAAQRTRDP